MKQKYTAITVILSVASAVYLLCCVFYYTGIGSDGGWYSYPALAISRGGDPAENTYDVQGLEKLDGVKAAFPFQTFSTLRTYYTTCWFRIFPSTIPSIKVLSLIEFVLMISAVFVLFFRYIKDKSVALLFFCLFLNDKSILISSVSDFRPDIILTFLSVVSFLVIAEYGRHSHWLLLPVGVLMILTHLTGVIPFIFLVIYLVSTRVIEGERNPLPYAFLGLIAGIIGLVFLKRDLVFRMILPSRIGPGGIIAFAAGRMDKLFSGGIWNMLYKEYYRWTDYFFFSNIVMLILIVLLSFMIVRGFARKDIAFNRDIGIFVSSVLTLISLFVVDPHWASSHVFPVIPFLILSLGLIYHEHLQKAINRRVIVTLVCVNSLVTGILAYKIQLDGNRNNYNIATIREGINRLFDPSRNYMVIGPSEIWPFIEEDRNVVIIDSTRDGKNIKDLEKNINRIDYVILNNDYDRYGWRRKFSETFRGFELKELYSIRKNEEFIRIYSINRLARQ